MHSIFEILALIPFYFIGAFPTGILLARAYSIDLENSGSGNVGATNVARTLGRKLGVLTLIIDVIKGYAATWLGYSLSHSLHFAAWAGVFSILGHCFSIPGKMKGGKGVATSLGVIVFIDRGIALLCIAIFSLAVVITSIVSIGSMVATFSAPLLGVFRGHDDYITIALSFVALLVTFRHKDNLSRLMRGEEPKI